jgi:hypothetical protein
MFSVSEQDWRTFKEKIPIWQERHMANLCDDYRELLSADANASEKFWMLEKRVRIDQKSSGVSVKMKRSNAFFCILELLTDHIITEEDLIGFSSELIASVMSALRNH